ncbi:MAG: citramalate synthase, partial [Mariprofundaceae bacterium]|nr:citramalate synthase [Mariprofundaceae bacterium]
MSQTNKQQKSHRPERVRIFDTTLRDGGQTAGITFSAEDKMRIAGRLAAFGIDYIEGGWPGASPKDDRFFKLAETRDWSHSKLVAFGSTARPGGPASRDAGLKKLVASGADVACIFGKSWDLHVSTALGITPEENLALVSGSVSFLTRHFEQVFFDAEHFFDGYASNAGFALSVLDAAAAAGADALVLCDTNGGNLSSTIEPVVRDIVARYPDLTIGIHTHNDSELAVANALVGVEAGARQVQGTINGIGERCGNANLTSIIPALLLKMGFDCGIDKEGLVELKLVSDFVNEMANRLPWRHQPFVGLNAFAHKGGIHVSAVRKLSRLYEHIPPEAVGNRQRITVSDQAGRSNVLVLAAKTGFGLKLDANDPAVGELVTQVKDLEDQGFAFEAAEASFHLMLLRAKGKLPHFFTLEGFRVIDEKRGDDAAPQAEATVMLRVGKQFAHTASLGNGPVNAMDRALRAALQDFYPTLKELRLVDYKVRVLSTSEATEANVRVLIESTDGERKWTTVGVSTNII